MRPLTCGAALIPISSTGQLCASSNEATPHSPCARGIHARRGDARTFGESGSGATESIDEGQATAPDVEPAIVVIMNEKDVL